MSKFVEIHNSMINIQDIRRVEFLSDDVHTQLFPTDEKGEILVDYIPFEFAKIYTSDGEFPLVLDLYVPEEKEDKEEWFKKNTAYISMMMTELAEILKPVKITGKEYSV